MFSHEQLDIYKTYLDFATLSAEVAECAETWHAFGDHLERATESIGANAIRANCQRIQAVRASFIDIATGSVLECVACLDVANMKGLLTPDDLSKGRLHLWRIRGMLTGMRNASPGFLREESPLYGAPNFPHDRLDVYRTALQLVEWAHILQSQDVMPTRQRNKLDIAATGIPLNLAEGCGKPTAADKCKYLDTSYAHALQAALTLDLLVAQGRTQPPQLAEGKGLLERIVSMLLAWSAKLHGALTG